MTQQEFQEYLRTGQVSVEEKISYEGAELIPTVVENYSQRLDHIFLRWLGRKVENISLQKKGVTRRNLYKAILELRDKQKIARRESL